MNETGNHHSQQLDTRTVNEMLHVLTHKWVLNNENTRTQGEEHHTLGAVGVGRVGRDNMGRNDRYGMNLKYNFKKR